MHWILIRVFPLWPLNLAPSPVREVSIPPDKIASYSIEVRWLPPAKLNGKIGYYLFYRKSSASSTTAERFVIPGSVHFKLVSGLKPFTNYTFSVVPYNLRKNLSGPPFAREGQTSAAGMHFTAFACTFTNDAWNNPSSSWKSKSRPSVLWASMLFRRISYVQTLRIGHFRVAYRFFLLPQKKPSIKTIRRNVCFPYKFTITKKNTSISYERFCTRCRSENKARGTQ